LSEFIRPFFRSRRVVVIPTFMQTKHSDTDVRLNTRFICLYTTTK